MNNIMKQKKGFSEFDILKRQKKNKKQQSQNKEDNQNSQQNKPQNNNSKESDAKAYELAQKLNTAFKETERLEREISMRQSRFEKREEEYRKIIQNHKAELDNKVQSKEISTTGMNQVYGLQKEILKNIDQIQDKTLKICNDQQKDILRFFNNKLSEIKKQFEVERQAKGQKDREHIAKESQLLQDLEWIKAIAQKIDNENHSLQKKYMDLRAQYQTQENDREMLLKELIMKKKKNAILKSQIEQYKKLMEELSNTIPDDAVSQQSKKNNEEIKFDIQDMQKSYNQSELRYVNSIRVLKNTLKKEQKRVHDLKTIYEKEIEAKPELERIIRMMVDEIREESQQNQKQSLNKKDEDNTTIGKEFRERLVDKLLSNDKVLTLVYDKTFYPDVQQDDQQEVQQLE